MAKACKYRLPGQETWMSEDDFKKSLADGLLDKFILDDKASIPSLRGFKADATAAEKFKAPVTEAKQTYSDVQKVTEDSYYDNVSNNLIEKDGKNWNVKNEVTGEVYHTAKSLKDATNWQETENQIIGRSVESKASETAPTEEKQNQIAKKAEISPKNLRDLYKVNKDLFELDRVKSFVNAIAMDRMIGSMARRAGVDKSEMYNRLKFEKSTEKDLPTGVKLQVDAWHGSPYQFDKFTTEKMGTGEGAQAFGWGLYFTDLKGIAERYAKELASKKEANLYIDGKLSNDQELKDAAIWLDRFGTEAIKEIDRDIEIQKKGGLDSTYSERKKKLIQKIKDSKIEFLDNRNLYKVSLHKGKTPDQYTWLEWDKKLSNTTKQKIKNGINNKNLKDKINSLNADFNEKYSKIADKVSDKRALNFVIENFEKAKSFDKISSELSKSDMSIVKDLHENLKKSKKINNLLEFDYQLNNFDGKNIYSQLSSFLGGAKEASLFLLDNGIDGVKYPSESISRGATSDTARGFNYVVFDENAVSIEETIKFQKDANKARGAAMVAMDGKAVIYALTDPNVSTPMHELAHVYEHYLTDAERNKILKAAGTNTWNTKTSEYFARGFEKYLSDGKSPIESLTKVFEKFKEWLTDIYSGIKNSDIDINLNKDMKSIYDTIFKEGAPKPTTKKETTPRRNIKKVSVKLTQGQVNTIKRTPTFKKYFSDSQIENLKEGDNVLSMNNVSFGNFKRMGIGEVTDITEQTTTKTTEPTTKAEPKPTTEKVERKGFVEVEAETKRGTKTTYMAEVSENGKTATIKPTYDPAFGGIADNKEIPNLPISVDSKGNRYVQTKGETRVYIDKVKEAPKAKEAPVKEEVQGKGQPTKVKIYAREPKLDDRGMPIISKFNQEVEFTKNKRTGKWETTDKAGNKIEATEEQAARADKALAEQPKKTTKQKISDGFDSLKIPKDRLFSIPYPVDIHNKIIELAKRLVLKGVDVASAIKQATAQVVEKRKAQGLISNEEAKKIEDYNNSKAFTDKINEAIEGEERVSGIKKELTSETSKEIAEVEIERMTIKEALDAGQDAIESKEVVPDKLITSIIGGKNPRTGEYENGQSRPLTVVETAAMVYYKTSLDNELENAYNDLNKAIDSENIIDQNDAKAQIAKLEEKVAEYEVMANVTAYEQGLSLRLRSMMLNSKYDLVKQKAKIKAEYGGKIPADVEQRLNELDKQLRETNAKLAELEKQREKTEDEEVVNNIKETKDTEKKSAVSKDGKIKVSTADIRQAVINGAKTIDEVVNAVRDSVKKQFPKATDRQIRDAITNYGKSRSETKDAIKKKINEMKRVGRLLSELEDIQKGIKKAKNKVKRDALTEREKELKQKIKEELSKIPLTDEEIADLQAERLERFKKTSEKAIEELQKKIDNKDFDKKKRDLLLDLDKEANELRAKREEIKFKFDLEFEKAQRNRMTSLQKLGEQLIKAISASKSLIASLDFSAPFRQGSVFVLTQNPIKTAKQLGKQFQFWWSENSYNQWLNGIKSSEYYPLLKASGLYIAEENAKLTAAEEAFMSNFMNKIPLVGKPIAFKSGKKLWGADLYGRAERAYTGFLNNLRVQAFLDVAEKMSEAGISPKTNIDEFKSWADYVNNATGRGTAGKNNFVGRAFEASAPALSLGLFSPRFLWSRLNITGINPSMYYRMSPIARKQAIKRTMGYFSVASTILGLMALALNDDDDEVSVELDPRSSDFAKIKIGNTRVDILAGNQQIFRTIAQAYTGERKKLATGEIEKLGQKYGSTTQLGVVGNFFVNKFSPIASIIYKRYALSEPEKKMREEEEGEKSDVKSVFLDLTIPLYLQDIKDLSKDHGVEGALGLTLLSVFGLGVQNMQPKEKSVQQSSSFMDEFEKQEMDMMEDDSYDKFEEQEQKLLEGF